MENDVGVWEDAVSALEDGCVVLADLAQLEPAPDIVAQIMLALDLPTVS